MPGRFLLVLSLCVALAGGGCATVKNVESFEPKPYGGVTMPVDDFFVGSGFFLLKPVVVAVGWPFWLLDKPFSLVGDTITLPHVLWKLRSERLAKGGQNAEPPPTLQPAEAVLPSDR